MKVDILKKFLDTYFILMDLIVISYGQINEIALGIVTGKDEKADDLIEHIYFVWHIDSSDSDLYDCIKLCEFLKENHLVDGDKILILEQELINRMEIDNWDFCRRQKVIEKLLSIEIKMVHDSEETDSFYIHF